MRGHHRITLEKTPRVRVWSAAEKEKVKDLFLEGYSDAEVNSGLLRRVRTINGYAYEVAEE